MKRIILSVTCTLLSLTSLFAQEMSKDEEKEWKSKLKSMDVYEFKTLVENDEQNQVRIGDLENEVKNLNTENARLQAEIEDYKRMAEEAQAQAQAAEQAEPEAAEPEATAGAPEQAEAANAYESAEKNTATGLVYKVQIGAFKNFDITKYFGNNKNFSGEVDSDGTMKYTLGLFGEYWEADTFKKYLRDMGVKGAWVVAYKDGKRVPMKDAREGTL